MSKKFGAGKQPTGTPSLGWSSVVAIVSLLAGASVVHSIYKPNLVTIFFFISLLASYIFFAHNLFDKMSNSSPLIFIFVDTASSRKCWCFCQGERDWKKVSISSLFSTQYRCLYFTVGMWTNFWILQDIYILLRFLYFAKYAVCLIKNTDHLGGPGNVDFFFRVDLLLFTMMIGLVKILGNILGCHVIMFFEISSF